MIAWLVWFVVAPQLYWLDRVAAGAFGGAFGGLFDAAIALLAGLSIRVRALPAILVCAAIGRSLLGDGPVALHLLAVGLPVAALIPLRSVFVRGSILWQGAAAAFVALAMPRVATFFGRLTGQSLDEFAVPGVLSVLLAVAIVPALAFGLCRVPPLSAFVERSS